MSDPLALEENSKVIPPSETNRNIVLAAKGGGFVFVSQIIASLFGVLFSVITARFLGAEDFGLFRLGFSFMGLAAAFPLVGLQSGVVRYIPLTKIRKSKADLASVVQIGILLPGIISILLAGIIFIFAETISIQFFQEPALVPVLRLLAFYLPISALMEMVASIAQGFKRAQFDAYARIIAPRVLKVILVTILLMLGFGVDGVVFAQIIASAIGLAMLLYFVHTVFPLNQSFQITKVNFNEVMRFSLPIHLSRLLRDFGGRFETLTLGFVGLTAGVGIFSAASTLSSISNAFYDSLARTTSPIFAELHGKKKFDQLANIYQSVTRWAVTFNLPFFLLMIFFGESLLAIFGKDFQAGTLSLVILAIGSLLNAGTGMCGPMLNMIGRSKLSAINSFLYLLVTIILDIALIPYWGLLGAAIAASATVIFMNLLRTAQIYYILNLWPINKDIFKPLLASLGASFATYSINLLMVNTPMFVQTIVGVFVIFSVYTLIIVLLKFSPEDLLVLEKFGNRLHVTKYFRR